MSIMRVRFQISGLEGLPGLHTTYWTGASSTPVQADATDVSARVRAFWNSFSSNLAVGTVITPVQGVDLIDQTDGALVGGLTSGTLATVTGTGTGSLPSATMQLLKLQTGVVVNGRRLQGRSFIGPLSTLNNSNGNPTGAANTNLLTAAAFFNTGATASLLVVWHRPTEPGAINGSTSPVLSYGTNTEFAILRSRRD